MKRIICLVLTVVMLASVASISASALYSWNSEEAISAKDALANYEQENGVKVPTKRYYFLMPDGKNGVYGKDGKLIAPSWYNEFTGLAGIYWDGSKPEYIPAGWIGYVSEKGDAENVFYADVPASVTTIIWNNGIDGGMDSTQEIYYKAAQTVNIGSEYYDPGESALYPDGVSTFDGMIYVIDPDNVGINEYSQKQTCGGNWYFYYGDGCFGTNKDGVNDLEHNCLNIAHDHSVKLGDVDGDGFVTVMDATRILKYSVQLIEFSDSEKAAADVDGDKEVSVMDATRILKYCVKICNLDGSKPYVENEK